MSNPPSGHLRLYTEQAADHPPAEEQALGPLCAQFEQATGWPLHYVPGRAPSHDVDLLWSAPVDPGVGATPGHLRLDRHTQAPPADVRPIGQQQACELAALVAEQATRTLRAEQALRLSEAELAAGVPVTSGVRSAPDLAERLEAVLRCGAQAIGCQAAGLYLLDEWTTSLKLRAAWQLPVDRLTLPPRSLELAKADLEALAGHGVAIESPASRAVWNPPEDGFASAVCVPVSSPTVPLGTLWLFSERARAFSDEQMNLAEMTAGRLAADLEREMLLVEARQAAQWKWQMAAARRWQENQQPAIAPLLDGWEVAGCTQQAQEVGGDFHDWCTRPDGMLLAAVGHCLLDGFDAALSATLVRAALRSHGQYVWAPSKLLESINHTLWTCSAGDQFGSLLCATLRSSDSHVSWASAGGPSVTLVDAAGCRRLTIPTLPLGLEPSAAYEQHVVEVPAGGVLLLASQGLDPHEPPVDEAPLGEILREHLHEPAVQLLDRARQALADVSPAVDRSVLLLKRRN